MLGKYLYAQITGTFNHGYKMARSTVEFFGGQLDGAILSNAASEATLQELLKAVNGQGSGGSSSGGGAAGSSSSLSKIFWGGGLLLGTVTGQLSNVAGAAGTMTKMLLQGESKLSQFTTVLNTQVISKLPIFGRYLGMLGGALNSGISTLEGWNTTLQTLTRSGATFNNSILQMMNSAALTYMSLDEFASMVNQNSHKLVRFGDTVTEGTIAFTGLSNYLLRSGGYARETLIEMGFSVGQVNRDLLDYMDVVYRGGTEEVRDRDRLGRSFVQHRLAVDRITRLTGKQYDQIQQEMAVASEDVIYRLMNSRLSTDTQREQMHMFLTTFTSMYGEQGAKMFRAARAGVMSADEQVGLLHAQQPELFEHMRRLVTMVEAGEISEAQMLTEQRGIMTRAIRGGVRAFREFGGIYDAAMAGNQEAIQFQQAFSPVLDILARMGINVDEATDDQINAAVDQAMAEQNSRAELTDFLREFEMAMIEFKNGFLFHLTREGGPLDTLSAWLAQFNLDGGMRRLGEAVGGFLADGIPKFQKFLEKFITPEGREMLMNELAHMFDTMGVYLVHYLPRLFSSDAFSQAALDADIATLDAEHAAVQSGLQSRHDARIAEMQAAAQPPVANPLGGDPNVQPYIGGGAMGGAVRQLQGSARFRNRNISAGLMNVLGEAARRAGVNVDVTSGGQMSLAEWNALPLGMRSQRGNEYFVNGQPARKGSTRHDGGGAADLDLRDPLTNAQVMPGDPRYYSFISAARRAGATGMGAGEGYMTPGRIHMGFGNPGVWGSDFTQGTVDPDAARAFGYMQNSAGAWVNNPGFSEGTLGTMGSLFADFGDGTETMLHGEEAVVTPPQMAGILNGTVDGSMREEFSVLIENVKTLVGLSERKLRLSQELEEKSRTRSGDNWAMVS